MKIVVVVRTKNEVRNIARFCAAYKECADLILVADGGSEDYTVPIAKCFNNVKVRHFEERIEFPGGLWRNPHGKHMNFMFDWAVDEGADWIIFDDCDSVPTATLKENIREIMTSAVHPTIFADRLYIWGRNKYFPKLNESWTPLYAWRPEAGIVAEERNPIACQILNIPPVEERVILKPPLCCLHYFCPDKETAQAKLDFYITIGEQKDATHPLEFGGPLEDLPEWAHE